MPKYLAKSAEVVSEVMASMALTQAEVARRSQGTISQRTVSEMMRGLLVGSDLIVSFALAVEGDEQRAAELANRLLTIAERRVRYIPVEPGTGETGERP